MVIELSYVYLYAGNVSLNNYIGIIMHFGCGILSTIPSILYIRKRFKPDYMRKYLDFKRYTIECLPLYIIGYTLINLVFIVPGFYILGYFSYDTISIGRERIVLKIFGDSKISYILLTYTNFPSLLWCFSISYWLMPWYTFIIHLYTKYMQEKFMRS